MISMHDFISVLFRGFLSSRVNLGNLNLFLDSPGVLKALRSVSDASGISEGRSLPEGLYWEGSVLGGLSSFAELALRKDRIEATDEKKGASALDFRPDPTDCSLLASALRKVAGKLGRPVSCTAFLMLVAVLKSKVSSGLDSVGPPAGCSSEGCGVRGG